jgi:glycosidase
MPKLVMIAKSTYVWLDQLSKKYKKEINRLDDIPEEELKLLAQRGFTGLWLIGIWQRSAASQKIKHLTGNEDAIASAYSLYDYEMAANLGGEEALDSLVHLAWKYGIRLGCDMVPNHVGIDSKWIYQHPDWFIQTSRSPFPNYTFSKLDLSSHSDFEIYLEEHYFDRTDAAVVFKMHDHLHRKTRYIYHGNDGTSFPWNDTAQLNYLLPEVRKAVIEEIKNIARRFPIIRFDAAMTLAKKHFQRLWYPQPGTGGDIPSRSQFGLTKTEFNQQMPEEFWRQVVDEINKELPDTLLLAEAFWMMEGYFVRTLGMHRVYNSAFMNMLKDEENEKYQQSLINVLKFNPQILKRFVNFMSNPDEETAIAQFGADDKYFGVCVMMSTLPGLPMFAHGQVEGYKERYGMEFAKAKWQEEINTGLVQRHQQEIFPILKKRYLFANVNYFKLLNFETEHGDINKNVFAYCNGTKEEKALVLYHNCYAETNGRVHSGYDHHKDKKVKLATIMQLPNKTDCFVIFYDLAHDLEYIFSCAELHQQGLPIKLPAFKYHVFLKQRLIEDNGLYKQVWQQLQGQGTANIDHFVAKLKLQPLLDSFAALLSEDDITHIIISRNYETTSKYLKENYHPRLKDFLKKYSQLVDDEINYTTTIKNIKKQLLFALRISNYVKCRDVVSLQIPANILKVLKNLEHPKGLLFIRFFWIILRNLETKKLDAFNLLQEKLLQDEILKKLEQQDLDAKLLLGMLKIALLTEDITNKLATRNHYEVFENLIFDNIVSDFIQINKYDDILWFNQERFNYFLLAMISSSWFKNGYNEEDVKLKKLDRFIGETWQALKRSEFKVDKLLSYFRKEE